MPIPVEHIGTHPLTKQLLTRALQTLSALLDTRPRIHHP